LAENWEIIKLLKTFYLGIYEAYLFRRRIQTVLSKIPTVKFAKSPVHKINSTTPSPISQIPSTQILSSRLILTKPSTVFAFSESYDTAQTYSDHITCWLRLPSLYRGADKSLARPGRKHSTATEVLMFIYSIYNHNWRNISTIYIYNKTSIKRNILWVLISL
jgi:hypothetical protein